MSKKTLAKALGGPSRDVSSASPPLGSPLHSQGAVPEKDSAWDAPVLDAAVLRQSPGAQEGIARYCEQSFTTPEFTAISSEALVNAFAVNLIWLADLIQPPQLIAELRQSCCYLTSRIIMYWIRQGQTHKLARLADAIQQAEPPLAGNEAGRIMVLLAGMLGVLRPERARRLQELGQPMLNESENSELIHDAIQWVNAGEQLLSCTAAERILWNQRLRDPEEDWEWNSAEARQALNTLAKIIQTKEDDYSLFQTIVPSCWWDLAIASGQARQEALSGRKFHWADWIRGEGFGRGLLTGAAAFILFVFILLIGGATGILPSLGPRIAGSSASPSVPSSATYEPPKPQSSKDAPRIELLTRMFERLPAVKRLHAMVKTGNMADIGGLMYGKTSLAAAGSAEHNALLASLLLDPPNDPDVRRAAQKLITRVVAPQDLFPVLEATIYPESVNNMEARQVAELTMELHESQLTEADRARFKALLTQ